MESEYQEQASWLIRLSHGADLLESLNKICQEKGIEAGVIKVIGAVKTAKVGFYNQSTREYQSIDFNSPQEIASCTGNISLKDSAAFVHMHIVLTDQAGQAKGGHLMPGTVIFAAEALISQFKGQALNRQFDPVTGLGLWT